MGRTAEKVTDLVEEEPGMADAIEAVLERTRDDDDGTVEWSDVRDDITSGQWGRLIERGILVDDEEGFQLADVDDVEDALYDDDVEEASEDDDGGWRTIDKLAGVSAVGMILGYNFSPIRNAVGNTLDLVLGPVTGSLPFYGVVLVAAVLTGVASVLVQGQMMDNSAMDGHREKMEELKERRKRAQENDDQEALEQINQEQQELVMEQFGNFASNFRPMVWTMAVSIPIFLWMYWQLGTDPSVTSQTMVMPMLGEMGWRESALAVVPFPAWIVWYFLCSMSLSQLLRKALNIQTTPG